MKVTHKAKDKQAKAILPENSEACTTTAFSYWHVTGAAKQKLVF
jgi:hypothetical protein